VIFTYLGHFADFDNRFPPLKSMEKKEGEIKASMATKAKYIDLVAIK
jgi:hypothetical protein